VKAQVRTSFTARTVGKIDESHLMSGDQLEAIRMLTNGGMDYRSPLTILLIGQPTLRRRLRVGDMAALVISSLS